jgi:UDP-N-acetylglucosamine 2-epimerase (non-hydrolysing)
MRIMPIYGTRPEAIKLAPVLRALRGVPGTEVITCVTGQHREMLDQVNQLFGVTPDIDLGVMTRGQSLTGLTTAVLCGLEPVLREHKPDWVIVQGDTTTAFAAGLAAFYQHIPTAHVEAGLRTGDLASPWPEEMNRQLAGRIAGLHFAPTAQSRANLLHEGVAADKVRVTGNTVIDALMQVLDMLRGDPTLAAAQAAKFGFLDPARRLVLVTGHRRENFNGGLDRVCRAIAEIADRDDVQVVYPVHLNPVVQAAAGMALSAKPNVHLLPPLDYLSFVWMMDRAHIIVTDSGGVQEEAPSLGKPVLVTRDTTERPEAVEAGTVRLVGTLPERLVREVTHLLDDAGAYAAMAGAHNPYGDGYAAGRVAGWLTGGWATEFLPQPDRRRILLPAYEERVVMSAVEYIQ